MPYDQARLFERGEASGLELAAALANTDPAVWGEDRLAEVDQLRSLLAPHGLVRPAQVSTLHLDQARELRAALREVFAATEEEDAVQILNRILASAQVRPRLDRGHDGDWRWRLEPDSEASTIAHVAAAIAVALLALIQDEGLDRLGACVADRCAGVFIDTTRNRSRRYCTPEICGNRANLAAYRARKRRAR